MSMKKGMSRTARISIIMVIILLLISGGVVGGVLILGSKNADLPHVDVIKQLEKPLHVSVDNDWVLRFDKVEKAEGYQVAVGYKTGNSDYTWETKTNLNLIDEGNSYKVDVSEYIQNLGEYSFQVKALHKTNAYNSDWSAGVNKTKDKSLPAPTNVWLNSTEMKYGWDPVNESEVKSYLLKFEDNNNKKTEYYVEANSSTGTVYSFKEYLDENPSITSFTVSVCASSRDSAGNSIAYVKDSDFVGEKTYTKAERLPILSDITIDFGEIKNDKLTVYNSVDSLNISWSMLDADNSISQNYGNYIDYFMIYLGQQGYKISADKLSVDLVKAFNNETTGAKLLGEHTVRVEAVFKENVDAEPISKSFKYSVRKKFEMSNVTLEKSDLTLMVSWDSINNVNAQYELQFWGRNSESGDFDNLGDDYSVKLIDTEYSQTLAGSLKDYKSIKVKVRAVPRTENGLYEESDWVESDILSVSTQLLPINNIRLDKSDQGVNISWSNNDSNPGTQYTQYKLEVYNATTSGSQIIVGILAKEIYSDATTISITEELKKYSNIDAGSYVVKVSVVPKEDWINYYTASEATQSDIFEYKKQLASPSVITLSCDKPDSIDEYGTPKRTFIFMGVEGAEGYNIVIKSSDDSFNSGVIEINQPADFSHIDVSDMLDEKLKDIHAPNTYSVTIMAISDSNGLITNSGQITQSYTDKFVHKAVGVISVTTDTVNPNKITVSWENSGSVSESTMTSPYYRLKVTSNAYLKTYDPVYSNASGTTSTVLDEDMFPGEYEITVVCPEIFGKYFLNEVSTKYTFNYTILDTDVEELEINDELINQTGNDKKIRISFAYPEAWIKSNQYSIQSFAIRIGNDADIHNMTLDTTKKIVYYDADFELELPLYVRKNTTIYIGGSVATDSTITRQDYINAYKTKTVDLVNAYEACTPILQNSDDGATITITIPAEAVAYTTKISYQVIFLGNVSLSGELTSLANEIANEMTLDLSSLKGSDGFMPTGEYKIKVQAVSKSGQESDLVELNYEQALTLSNITGFIPGDNNAYLQWNQVPSGSGYSVIYSVEILKDNETLGTDASLGLSLSYGTDSEGNDYVRLPTTQLFSDNGKGKYTFKITASGKVNWIISSTTQYVWVFESKLNAPSFEVKKDGDKVYVEIITSQFVKDYVVTVPGFKVDGADYQVTTANANTSTQKIYLDKLNAGGQFVISVVANPISNNLAPSDASTQKFVNSVSPSAPDNVSVVQDGDNVKLSWTPKKWTIWSVGGESATGTEYDLDLCIQVYKNNTPIADNIEIGNSGAFTLTADSEKTNIQNLMTTLKANVSEYYVYFYTKPDTMNVVDSDGVVSEVDVLTKGNNVAVNFTYRAKLETPTFTRSGSNRLTATNSLEFDVTKDSRALTIGIQIATKNSSGKYDNFATLGGQTVNDDGKYVLSASAISGITSGTYYIRANAIGNAGFNSSDYTKDYIEFTYAESLGKIGGIQVSQEYKSSTDSGTGNATYKLFVTFGKVANAGSYTVYMMHGAEVYENCFKLNSNNTDENTVSFVLDYSNSSKYSALQTAWGENPADGLSLKFSITANPTEDNKAFWDSAETQYIYSVDGVAVPTGFEFSLSADNKLTVSWQHGTNGTAYTTSEHNLTYSYTLSYQSNGMTSAGSITGSTFLLGRAIQSVTIDLSEENLDLGTTAYLFTFKITDIEVKNASDSSSAAPVARKSSEDTIEAQWVNIITNTNASITISYDESNGGTYTIEINHKSGNNNVFVGQTYTLYINGESIFVNEPAGENTEITSVKFSKNSAPGVFERLATLSKAQESYNTGLSYSLTISNASVSGNSALIGYAGGTVTGTAKLPILISMAPNVTIDLDNTTATWGEVTHATKYGFDITDTSGNSVIGGEKTTLSKTYNFSTQWASLVGGDYKIVVRVIADTSNHIYVSTDAVSSTDVRKYVYMQDVGSFTITTSSNTKGDFMTDITWWYYNDKEGNPVDTDLFELTVTDAKGAVVDLGANYKSMIHINACDVSASRTQFVLTFVGRDLTQVGYPLASNVVDGVNYTYDPTRNWQPGDYNISITVLSNDDSNIYLKSTTSELKQYQNKFGVAKVSGTAESLFTIAPDCYLNADGTVKEECKDALAQYEKQYGFNKKLLILTATGQSYNLGTHYKITVNGGNQTGYIINSSSDLSDILNTINSYIEKRLDISNWLNAGINTISIMPTVQDAQNTITSYYAYIDEENNFCYFSNKSESNVAKIQSALTTTFEDIVCYKRYETPSSDYNLYLGYNDTISGTKHNLSEVNVVFDSAKAHKNYLYSVKLYYSDNYYNNGTEISEPILLGNDFTSLITDNINYGIQLYDSIKGYGPHKMWFEISVVGDKDLTETQSQYYLESVVISTKNNAFINKTAVQEFSENEASQNSRTVSRVLEYTSENCEEDNDHKKNGCLRWNLTENPYDMVIKYAVTLKDVNKSYAKTYTAKILLTVTNGVREYAFKRDEGDNTSDTGPFFLENASDDGKSYLYFDMTEYFLNIGNIRANVADYLAGTYYYTISATALDKDGNKFSGADVAIFSPVNTYPIDSDKKFEYKNVVYPFAPYEAVLAENGVLTWNYPEYGNKYSTGDIAYKIRIDHLVTENGVSHWKEDVDKNLNTKEMRCDIANYLIAGGKETNRVYVCRVSPDTSLYLNSKYAQAEYNFPTDFTMPKLNLEWVDTSIKYSIVDPTGDAYKKMKTAVESSSENKTWYELNVIRVDSSVLENIAVENQNYDYIINNTEIEKTVIKFNGNPTKTDATEYLESLYYNIGGTNDADKFFNLLEEIKTRVEKDSSVKSEDWIANDKLLPGTYFVNMCFCTNTQYYNSSDNQLTHNIKQPWSVRSLDDVDLYGEYLTTKTADEEVSTGEKTRNWANADKKSAVLKFQVKTIRVNGVSYLPSKVTVIARRVSQDEDSTAEEEEEISRADKTYILPKLADLGSNDDYYTLDDVTISRVTGIGNENYIKVEIDLHALFDTQDKAGPYELLWRINGDDYGAESYDYNNSSNEGYYVYDKYLCHYTVLQTPILDYRMDVDIDETAGSVDYKLNWALTPNPNSYAVNVVDCNVNIFAFPEKDGTFAYDELYQATENKNFYLQDKFDNADFQKELKNAGVKFVTNRSVEDCSYVYSLSDSNMELEPNTTYKFFIFLRTSKVSSGEFLKYYLNSETSAPVVYTYKKVSPSFAGVAVKTVKDSVYYVEGSDNKNEIFYTISAVQNNNDYNNAIELYVYDTQDADATNASWTENQEINGDYLAHYIISTQDNAKFGNLHIVTVNADGTLEYGKQVGSLLYENLQYKYTLDGLTLADMLYNEGNGIDRTTTAITYYCKIKSWINNYEVNKNAYGDDGQTIQTGKTQIYSADWIRETLGITDEAKIQGYLAKFAESNISTIDRSLLDINALNPSIYFTLQHRVEFQKPMISKIEIIDGENIGDVSGSCVAEYTGNADGTAVVTDGYITANNDGKYIYRIWLNNVYNTDPAYRADKNIVIAVKALKYDGSGKLSNSTNSTDNDTSNTYRVTYVQDSEASTWLAYVDISAEVDENVTGESIFSWINKQLPNTLVFSAKAVQKTETNYTQNADDSATQTLEGSNVGGANSENEFYLTGTTTTVKDLDGNTLSAPENLYTIARIFANSEVSADATITVKKQYATPVLDLLYGNQQSGINLLNEYGVWTKEIEGTEKSIVTNVLSDEGNSYDGMALDPYLNMDVSEYTAEYELLNLKNNETTKYKVTLTYIDPETQVEKTIDCYFDTTYILGALNNASKDANLYDKIYDLINEDLTDGSYHGGKVQITVSIVTASEPAEAGYWVGSDAGDSELMFYARMEQVSVQELDPDKAQYTMPDENDTGYHIATYYAKKELRYLYYQNYIPVVYNSIKKSDVTYRVILTNNKDNLVYNFDTLEAKLGEQNNPAEWIGSATVGEENTGNLAELLGVDLNDALNQWDREKIWTINILAYSDVVAPKTVINNKNEEFITRGLDSEARTYQPQLKIVNDIDGEKTKITTIDNEEVIDITDDNLSTDDLKKYIAYTPTEEITDLLEVNFDEDELKEKYPDQNGDIGNRVVIKSKFKLYYQTLDGDGNVESEEQVKNGNEVDGEWAIVMTEENNLNSKIGAHHSYVLKVILDRYFKNYLRPGGSYVIKDLSFIEFYDVITENGALPLDESKPTDITFEYYTKINPDDILIEAVQEDTAIKFTGTVKNELITAVAVRLKQTTIENSTDTESLIKIYNSSECEVLEDGSWTFTDLIEFNVNKADCFSDTSFDENQANLLTTRGYVSSDFAGYIQAGINKFRFYPLLSGSSDYYRPNGFYKEADDVNFIVPESLCPSVSLSYSTDEDGGGRQLRTSSTWHSCEKTVTTGSVTYSDCGTCHASGKVTKKGGCLTCHGTGEMVTGYGPHDYAWSLTCHHCGKDLTHFFETTCYGNPKYGTCTACSGSGYEYYTVDCSACSGKGTIMTSTLTTVTCSKCKGNGYYYTYYNYYYNYAYYKYITKVTPKFNNYGGATAIGDVEYGWKSNHSGSCTKTVFNKTANYADINELIKGISTTGANYAKVTVMINCKEYFEDVFKNPTHTVTKEFDVSSYHYEAYTGSQTIITPTEDPDEDTDEDTDDDTCQTCGGTGEVDCSTCNGTGKVQSAVGYGEHSFVGTTGQQKYCQYCNISYTAWWRQGALRDNTCDSHILYEETDCTTCNGTGKVLCPDCAVPPYVRPVT